MGVLTRFRLDGGTNQQAARKLLPSEGLLRRVVNLELRRDNELGVRPGFTALGQGAYPNLTLVACDLIAYDDRLFALGRAVGGTRVLLFEYLNEVKTWGSFPLGNTRRLPNATRVRTIGRTLDEDGPVYSATIAVHGGYGVVAYETGASAVGGSVYAFTFRVADDAPLLAGLLSLVGEVLSIVTVAGKFFIVGKVAGVPPLGTLSTVTVDPATDTSFPNSPTGLYTIDTDVFAAAAVSGATGGYVTAGCLAGDIVIRHYNDSHVQQMTRTIAGVVPNYLAIAADSTANKILFGYVDAADSFPKYRTIQLTTGTDIAGPTTLIATTTTGAMSVSLLAGTAVAATITSTTPRKVVILSAAQAKTFTWHDAQLVTELFDSPTNPISITMAGFLQGTQSVNVLGVCEAGPFQPGWFQDYGTASDWPARLGSLTRDSVTGKYYTSTLRLNNDLQDTFAITEFDWAVAERRQVAIQGGLLHIAGGLPLVFDGRAPSEIGFGEAPVIYSLASSNSTGSVTSSAAYFIQAFAEVVDSRGNVHRGPPSDVYSITMGAADDTITGTISSLHSFRNQSQLGVTYRIVICRTAALADLTAGENLYRETSVSAGVASTTSWGAAVAFTLTTSDTALRALGETQGTIYTQAQTPIPHQAPPPFSYIWPTNERLGIGGLPATTQWLQSKLRFPGEAMHFSDADGFPGFQGSADESILAVGALSGSLVAFTRRTVSLWQGDGPDHSGQGEFTFAGFLSREGGINGADGWKSLIETDEGLFFQRDDEQLCMLTRAGVNWTIGQAVRDELATYPVVAAAAYIRQRYQVAFAVQNAAGNAGEILVLDLRRKVWTIIDVLAIALTEYQGRLVYADASGSVFQQNAAVATGAMPNQSLETFDFDFGAGLGWGAITNIGIIGTKMGDCTGTLEVTYDSGASYTTIETFTLTTANNYVTGKPVELEKTPPIPRCSRFGLRFSVTGGTATEGLRINEITLETETAPGMARLPARDTH